MVIRVHLRHLSLVTRDLLKVNTLRSLFSNFLRTLTNLQRRAYETSLNNKDRLNILRLLSHRVRLQMLLAPLNIHQLLRHLLQNQRMANTNIPFNLALQIKGRLSRLPDHLLLLIKILRIKGPRKTTTSSQTKIILLSLQMIPRASFRTLLLNNIRRANRVNNKFSNSTSITNFGNISNHHNVKANITKSTKISRVLPPLRRHSYNIIIRIRLQRTVLTATIIKATMLLTANNSLLLRMPTMSNNIRTMLNKPTVLLKGLLNNNLRFVRHFQHLIQIRPNLLRRHLIMMRRQRKNIRQRQVRLTIRNMMPNRIQLRVKNIMLIFVSRVLRQHSNTKVRRRTQAGIMSLRRHQHKLQLRNQLMFNSHFVVLTLMRTFSNSLTLILHIRLISRLIRRLAIHTKRKIPRIRNRKAIKLFKHESINIQENVQSTYHRKGRKARHHSSNSNANNGLIRSCSFSSWTTHVPSAAQPASNS